MPRAVFKGATLRTGIRSKLIITQARPDEGRLAICGLVGAFAAVRCRLVLKADGKGSTCGDGGKLHLPAGRSRRRGASEGEEEGARDFAARTCSLW